MLKIYGKKQTHEIVYRKEEAGKMQKIAKKKATF